MRSKGRRRRAGCARDAFALSPLEARQLLTVTVTGTAGNDTFLIQHRPAPSNLVNVYVNGSLAAIYNVTTTNELDVKGLAGNDTVQIDAGNGTPLPPAFKFFSTASPDAVAVTAGSVTFNDNLGANASAVTLAASGSSSVILNSGETLAAVTVTGGSTVSQSNYTVSVSGTLALGNTSSYGVYNLSGGTLSTGTTSVGDYNAAVKGYFYQTGGTHNTGTLVVDGYASYYQLSAGSLSATAGYVGYVNAGSLTQYNGSASFSSYVWVGGDTNNANGTYSLEGGTLSAGTENVGDGGTANFHQDGGTNTATTLNVNGYAPGGGTGTYTLTAGTLNTTTTAVATSGTGTFNQSGGTHNVTGLLEVGYYNGTSGTYTLSAGYLYTGTTSVGDWSHGTGTFTQTGGTHSSNELVVDGVGSAYYLSNGTLSAPLGYVGYVSEGSFYQYSGGATFSNFLAVGGDTSNAEGYYQLSGGTLSAGTEYVGDAGNAYFSQDGGSNTVTTLNINGDIASGGSGTYNLSAGTLTTTTTVVATSGTGSFYQYGGTHDAGQLKIGFYTGTSGYYYLGGGDLDTGTTYVGDWSTGTGTFYQDGGTHTTSQLDVNGTGSSYTIYSGTVNATTGYIGYVTEGSFYQYGGDVTFSNYVWLGGDTNDADGYYQLSGGTLTAGGEYIGDGGAAYFYQNGGENDATSITVEGYTPGGGTGVYQIDSGYVYTTDLIAGNYGQGSVVQNGGQVWVYGTLTVAANPSSTGTYTLNNGDLYLHDLAGNGGLTINGGTVTFI